jgi:hypothetical protein
MKKVIFNCRQTFTKRKFFTTPLNFKLSAEIYFGTQTGDNKELTIIRKCSFNIRRPQV